MTAVKTQGSTVSIETALASTKAISGATNANPCVVTSTGHGYTNGQVIKIANVVGMTELNERAFIANNVSTNTFELKGVDSTTYGVYASAGDSYLATMTAVGTVDGIPTMFAGTSPTIDVTHLKSVRSESIAGLGVSGTVSLSMIADDSDTGQLAMQVACDLQAEKCFTIQKPNGKVAAFVAFVTQFQGAAAKNGVYLATGDLLLRAAPSRFA